MERERLQARAWISAFTTALMLHTILPSNRACDVREALNQSGPTRRTTQLTCLNSHPSIESSSSAPARSKCPGPRTSSHVACTFRRGTRHLKGRRRCKRSSTAPGQPSKGLMRSRIAQVPIGSPSMPVLSRLSAALASCRRALPRSST